MFITTLRIGQGVTIGDDTFVRVDDKKGNYVKLSIKAPRTRKVDVIPDGILPPRFVTGVRPQERQPRILTAQACGT